MRLLKVKISILFLFLLGGMVTSKADPYKRVLSLRGNWKFTIGDNEHYANALYDDARWEQIKVPGMWEDQGFNGYDGYAWYRTTFNGRSLGSNQEHYYLNLGYIDDVDEVYINGKLIGITGNFPPHFYTAYQALRRYPIPKDIINFNGKNFIAVRIYDVTGEGGIISGNIGIEVNKDLPAEMINLSGLWKFNAASNLIYRHPDADDTQWGYKMVPGRLKAHGSDYAWYRKKIYLTEEEMTRDWILVLGKIDDFDELYINGVFIGKTNDGKPLGESNSWQTVRAYAIPPNIWKKGSNQIAVRVQDIGVDAGIYQGPIGLVPRSKLQEVMRLF